MAAPVLGQLLLGARKQLSFDDGWYGNPDPVLGGRWDLAKRADTVGEIVGLADSSTYVWKYTCIVASIQAETGSLSFLAQP